MRCLVSRFVTLLVFVGVATTTHAQDGKEKISSTFHPVCLKDKAIDPKGKSARIPPPANDEERRNTTRYILLPYDTVAATVYSELRKTRLAEDVATLLDIAKAAAGGLLAKAVAPPCVEYKQELERASVAIEMTNITGTVRTITLIEGPEEHAYITADIAVTKAKQLTFDSKTHSIVERDKPQVFNIGFNWKFGELYTQYPLYDPRRASIKFIVQPTFPIKQLGYGLGVGYDLKYAELFVARMYTKNDESAGGGRTASTIVGVSLNLTRVKGWVAPEK